MIILNLFFNEKKKMKVFVGFDGFIDRIFTPMKVKTSETAIPFQTMEEFSQYIGKKAGDSCSIDMQMTREKIGGNMPIVTNALLGLGCETVSLGAMGYPKIHALFRNDPAHCTQISVAEPGICDALEFQDGKLMLASSKDMDELDYLRILSVVPKHQLVQWFRQCDAFAFLNWGELLGSNDIWENLLQDVIPECGFLKKKMLLVDFSDFSRRSQQDVAQMQDLLQKLAVYFSITVSVNGNELELLYEKLHFAQAGDDEDGKIVQLSEMLHCENFVIHLLHCTKFVKGEMVCTREKEVVKNPKIITGAGDHFNAGLLFGLLHGLALETAVEVAAATSCLYVREAENINIQKLNDYLQEATI